MQRPAPGGRRGRPAAGRKRPPTAVGAALIVASAVAFALDGPVARAAYQQGLDPATFGFWRASAGVVVLGGWLPSCTPATFCSAEAGGARSATARQHS